MTHAADPAAAPAARPPSNFVGLALVVLWLALGWALLHADRMAGVLTFAFVMLGWILSVMAHEFCHALVAWLGGDRTVAEKGYLSFDPRRYGDLGTSLVIPLLALVLGGVGLPGAAVYLRQDLMRSPAWRAAASLAGPGGTLLVLLALAAVLHAWPPFGWEGPLYPALTMLAFLQAMALILNLLPIPGLDGFNAIRPFLPAAVRPHLRKLEGLGLLAVFLLVFVVPGASAWLFTAAAAVCRGLGLDLEALQVAWRLFHFWR